jgi:hypothetical protein
VEMREFTMLMRFLQMLWPETQKMAAPSDVTVISAEIEKKLTQLLVDDEAGWEAAANDIEAKIYNSEGIEIASYSSPSNFSSALMAKLDYQHDLPRRFARGSESLNDFEVAEELVWVLVPSGFIFGT